MKRGCEKLKLKASSWTTVFDWENKKNKLKEAKKDLENPEVWSSPEKAAQLGRLVDFLEKELKEKLILEKEIAELEELLNSSSGEEKELLSDFLQKIEQQVEEKEKKTLFSGKYDANSAILSLSAGAGGVDAQDWTEMLLRMYLRFCEKMNWKTEIIHQTRSAEAGIKSVALEVHGYLAYGHLKGEKGTHRLVRLSPFNANNLRQTSFALVEILPMLQKEEDFQIADKDLRIDTYRASGAGGQHVNKTDSAVRLTYLPLNLVASCQSERSQGQNKEKAMQFLKAKILQKKEEEREKKERELKGDFQSAEWGSQIRSYVLHPYKLVKDHRTGAETSDTERVLAGELLLFIEKYLRSVARSV